MLFLYQVVGFFVNKVAGKQYNFSQKIILGFITFTSLQWLVGFPSQFLHISWKSYFSIQSISYLFFLGGVIWWIFIHKNGIIVMNRLEIKEKLKNHFRNYWFLYLLTLGFGLFSVTSQLPYFEMNYDDHYYIGRIVQEIGSINLATENFFTGITAEVGFDRLITTYEIGYGFWSQLFQIEPSFFARFTMTFFNYLLLFFSIHAVFSPVIKKQNLVQFVLLLFPILLFPAGYLWDLNLFKPFDGWQLNTAMWYGGSIVRMLGIPLLFFSVQIFLENKFFGLLIGALTGITLIANSAVALTLIFVVGLCLLVAWLIVLIFSSETKWIVRTLSALVIIAIACAFVITLKIIPQLPSDFYDKILIAQQNFNIDNTIRMREGSLLVVFSLSFVIAPVFFRKKLIWIYWLTLVGSTMLLIIPQLQLVTMTTTLGYFFVASRVWTAVQYMFVIFTGYVILCTFSKLKYIIQILAVAILSTVIILNVVNLDKYKQLNFTPSGLSSAGYSVERLLENNHMIPEVIHEFGLYFNEQPEKQQVISTHFVNYEEHVLHLNAGMIMASNNLELCNSTYATCGSMTNEQKELLDLFANQILDDTQMQQVSQLIHTYELDQLIVQNSDVVNTLINNYHCKEIMRFEDKNGNQIYLLDISTIKSEG